MRWANGEAIVEQLLAKGHLERVQGAQADGWSWLDRARQALDAARLVAAAAPVPPVASYPLCGWRPASADCAGRKLTYQPFSLVLPAR
jgi:hypothetical protein